MKSETKSVDSLRVADFEAHPVWEFALDEEEGCDETEVRPLKRFPVKTLGNRIVGARVQLANGGKVWASMGNIDVASRRKTELFLSVSIFRGDRRFHLARYFDVDYAKRGPAGLARFLRLAVDDVFPIAYDLRAYAVGRPSVLAGKILEEPRERLSKAQIMALILDGAERSSS